MMNHPEPLTLKDIITDKEHSILDYLSVILFREVHYSKIYAYFILYKSKALYQFFLVSIYLFEIIDLILLLLHIISAQAGYHP